MIVYQFFISFKRFKLLGVEVQRLHEETEENDGENPLRRWPTTKGEIYNESHGIMNICFRQSNNIIIANIQQTNSFKDTYINLMVCLWLVIQAVMLTTRSIPSLMKQNVIIRGLTRNI